MALGWRSICMVLVHNGVGVVSYGVGMALVWYWTIVGIAMAVV